MAPPMEYMSQLFPSYADLPMEIILHIFRFLDHPDLQVAGTVCSRWRAALLDAEFNDRTRVRFSKICLSDRLAPASDFLQSERAFRSFYLEEVTFGPVQQLMAHIGKCARDVVFDNVDLTDKQFYAIIQDLPHLRHLTITRCSPLFMSGSFLDNNDADMKMERLLPNVKHLSLHDNQYLSDAILLRLTALIKCLESLDMSNCHIAYHNAIQRRFYPPSTATIDGQNNENDNPITFLPSESILTFNFIQRIISLHRFHLRELNFSDTFIGSPALLSLCDAAGGMQLLRLRLANCKQLNMSGLRSFLQTQPQLVVLDLSHTPCVNDDCLTAIVTATPLLEELFLLGCTAITNAGAALLGTLKQLQRLDISRCSGISSEGIIQGVARVPNSVLRELRMSHLKVCDECIKCVARNLPELRVLNVGHCVNGVCDESVQCIVDNLRYLRELSLEDCFKITDGALTGINASALGLQSSSSSSLENFNPPATASLAEREMFGNPLKISLRSKAEEEIVRDAQRKKAMLAAYEFRNNELEVATAFEGSNVHQLRGLRALNLKGCNRITDVSLRYGIRFTELRQLSLSNCQQISLLGMEALVQNCPSIEELDLSECYNISDKCVQVLTTKLSRLRVLHISGCSQLTDHSLDAILVNCKCLQTLSVYRCRRMYTDIASRLSELPTLRDLHMDNTGSIDNAEIFRLKKGLDY